MITKETFCAALGQILEQREIDEKVGAALESVGTVTLYLDVRTDT